jgi:hypothetical protein
MFGRRTLESMIRSLLLVAMTAAVCFTISATTGLGATPTRVVVLRVDGDAASFPDLNLKCVYGGQFGKLPPSLLCGQWVRQKISGVTSVSPLGVAVRIDRSRVTVEHYGAKGHDGNYSHVSR